MRWSYTDYYDVLDIEENATQERIETARRNRIKETHPDRGGDREEFLLIKEAYAVLSDKKDRSQYDRLGHSEYVRKFDGTEFQQTSGPDNTAGEADSRSDVGGNDENNGTTQRTNVNQRRRRDRTTKRQKSQSHESDRSQARNTDSSGKTTQTCRWENSSNDQLLNALLSIDPYQFEHFIADLWKYDGWETEVTTESNDKGLDVFAQKASPFQRGIAIQVKRYTSGNTVGSPDIQQYSSLKNQNPNVDGVVVVTTSSFTTSAQDIAESLDVQLVDGQNLIQMVRSYNAYDLLDKYIDTKSGHRSDSRSTATQSNSQNISSDSEKSDNRFLRVIISTGFVLLGYLVAIGESLGYAPPLDELSYYISVPIAISFLYHPYAIYRDSKYSSKRFGWPERRSIYYSIPVIILLIAFLQGSILNYFPDYAAQFALYVVPIIHIIISVVYSTKRMIINVKNS